MVVLTITLSALALLSLLFAGAIVIESRRTEKIRQSFLLSIHAPMIIPFRDGVLRMCYLIGSLLLVLLLLILPYLFHMLPLTDV